MTTVAPRRADDASATVDDGTDEAAAAPPPARPGRLRRRMSAPFAVAVAASVAAGAWAAVASALVLPHLSVNRDETVYLLQADALREGFLFPPAPEPSGSFTPWFAVESAGRFILKYTPVHAATLALGRALFGSERATIAIAAMAVVLLTYLLAGEVLGSRKQAAAAAVLVAISPLFLVQAMTFLSYVGNLALLLAFAVAFLRGVRTGGRTLLVVAGVALGLAFFARPYDAVLFSAPLGLWFVVSRRLAWTGLVPPLAWLGLGALAPLLATLLFNEAATGNPLEFPFSVLDPLDTIGFGPRRLHSGDPVLDYTPGTAVQATLGYGSLLTLWSAGGALAFALAVPGLRRARGPLLGVAGIAATVPLGYVFFWGPANVTWMAQYLGPFYYLPMLVPLSILAARGLDRLARWSLPIAAAAMVAIVACAGALTERVVRANLLQTATAQALVDPFEEAALDDAVVFLPGQTLLNPFGFARNDPSFDGPVVWALDQRDQNLAVLDRFADRTPFALRLPAVFGGSSASGDEQRLRLEELRVVRAPSVELPFEAQNRAPLPVFALEVAFDAGPAQVLVLDERSRVGKVHQGTVRFGPSGVAFVGSGRGATSVRSAPPPAASGSVSITLTAADPARSSKRPLGSVSMPYRIVDGTVEVLAPAAPSGAVGAARAVGTSS